MAEKEERQTVVSSEVEQVGEFYREKKIPKTLYLIRHAESLENERNNSLSRSLSSLGRLNLPTLTDLSKSVELFNIPAQVDSDVSIVGSRQISQLAERLRADGFLHERNVELVVHSPLKRAAQTAEGMLGCSAPSTLTAPVKRVESLDCLLEKWPSEWIPGNYAPFAQRIDEFEGWVCTQPEQVIAVVGHSQFFKAMLGLDYKFGNCDVWEVKFECGCDGEAGETVGSCDGEEKKDDSFSRSIEGGGEEKEEEEEEEERHMDSPRKWKDLKNLYRYEKSEDDEYPSS